VAELVVKNGPLAGRRFEVTGELVIGREHGGATFEDALVSRRHALVRALPGALEVEDLGSTNGTFIDGERLEGRRAVGAGAEIRVGNTVLEVRGVLPLEVTRRRPIAAAEATRLQAPSPTPDVTRAKARPPAERLRTSPPVGDFTPPTMRRRRGLASRSWVPVALSFGSVILTAVALVVYFAAR
jgi:hypothetical protein